MRTLTDSELLSAWETGSTARSVERALLLISLAYPDISGPEQLPIGERDALLLSLLQRTFGSAIACTTACTCCTEKLEVEFTVPELLRIREQRATDVVRMSHEGVSLSLRVPTSLDLMKLAEQNSSTSTGKELFGLCMIEATLNQVPISPETVPDSVVQVAGDLLSEADPLADVQIRLTCPSCENSWDMPFDITTYFWKEIDTWAWHTLRTVDLLAGEYGWSESDILTMTPARRQHYVDLITREHETHRD